MKTPRELLLKRHESANDKLDALRRNVLATECGRKSRNAGPWSVRIALKLWFELIRPAPRIWAGFAVVWIAIFFIHLAERSPSITIATIGSQADSAGILLQWKEQEKILAEFTGPVAAPLKASEPPKSPAPKPRSRRHLDWRVG